MITTQSAAEVRIVREYATTPERLYELWTRAEEIAKWCAPGPARVGKAEVDLRIGGRYSIRMDTPNGAYTAHGEYRLLDPPRKLSFTWNWLETSERAPADTIVTVEFIPLADKRTQLVLTHTGFDTAESAHGHEQGWNAGLEKFAALV